MEHRATLLGYELASYSDEIVRECQAFFGFKLPSLLLNISSDKFIRLYDVSDNVVCTSLRVN